MFFIYFDFIAHKTVQIANGIRHTIPVKRHDKLKLKTNRFKVHR